MDDINMNATQVRQMREARAWSQEHLATAAGVSLRTVQRVEAEGKASAETRLALAGAFRVNVADLSVAMVDQAENLIVPAGKISEAQYRLGRFVLIASCLLAVDLWRNGWPVWSHWIWLGGGLIYGLRWVKQHWVAPGAEH